MSFKDFFKPVKKKNFNKEELEKGISTEMEHTDKKEIAEIIAKHHLAEDPKYYSKMLKYHEEDENTVGGGALGPAAAIGHSDSSDWYATGDYRKPFALGGVLTRRGMLRKKKNKKNKK
jgi:hypothetical protein